MDSGERFAPQDLVIRKQVCSNIAPLKIFKTV